MRTLVISTATAACSVALLEEGAVVAADHVVVGRGHAERLVPMIAALPDGGRAGRILVDCGPGSFTGVRVGLAAAIGLGIGWDVAVCGFASTALLAAAARPGPDGVVVVTEGGHGELFVQDYAADLTPGALESLPPAAARVRVAARRAVGSGAAALRAVDPLVDAVDALPDARDAALLPATLADLPARPIYGRAPDAVPAGARV